MNLFELDSTTEQLGLKKQPIYQEVVQYQQAPAPFAIEVKQRNYWLFAAVIVGAVVALPVGFMAFSDGQSVTVHSTKTVEKIVEKPIERVVEKIVEKPVEKIVERVVEKPVQAPEKPPEKVIARKPRPAVEEIPDKPKPPEKAVIADQDELARKAVVGVTWRGEDIGSAVVVSSSGYVVTACHVGDIAMGEPFNLHFQDGTNAICRVVWRDPRSDACICQIDNKDGKEFPYIPLSKGGHKTGDKVTAYGFPGGWRNCGGKMQTRQGSIRQITHDSICTDCEIRPGDSGGALVSDGKLIGTNSRIVAQMWMGQVIKMDQAWSTSCDIYNTKFYRKGEQPDPPKEQVKQRDHFDDRGIPAEQLQGSIQGWESTNDPPKMQFPPQSYYQPRYYQPNFGGFSPGCVGST